MIDSTPSREVMKQVNDVMRDQLGGCVLTQCDGPNSLLEFWRIGKYMVIVQIWNDSNGWEYYLQGKTGKVSEIEESIKKYFDTAR